MRALWQSQLREWFQLERAKTNLSTEVLAGLTTFLTMAYILLVNAQILSNAIFLQQPQDLQGELIIATAIPVFATTPALVLVGALWCAQFGKFHGKGGDFCLFSDVGDAPELLH